MLTVLIVDDEVSIREGLPYLIDWQEYGYEIVGTACNGEEGLAKIIELQPDVVIADIQMPGKNGLDMVKEARNQQCNFTPIILSGYSDFAYAREAIRLGVISYLLKPIDESELIDILEGITRKSTNNYAVSTTATLMEKLFGGDDTGLHSQAAIKAIRVRQDTLVVPLKDQLASHYDAVYMLVHRYNQYLIILSKAPFNETELESILVSYLPETEILISNTRKANDNLKKIANDIQELTKLAFLFPNQLVSASSIASLQNKKNDRVEVIKKLIDCLINNRELAEVMANYSELFYQDLPTEETIKWLVMKDFESILQEIQALISIRLEWNVDIFHQELYMAQNFAELMHTVNQNLSTIQEIIRLEVGNTDIIAQIIDYTNQNFKEDLSLKKIGELFNYNSAYVGKKFRKQTGKNYLAFLEEVRLKRAADVLKNSRLMVYEVANMVGYTNVDYFYKKFKQYYHLSPNEFRKKCEV